MNTKKVLIVSDSGNRYYWSALTNEIEKKIGPVRIVLDNDISRRINNHSYDVIVVDVSNIEDLYRLIPKIHHDQPRSRIIIVSSSPTWEQTRDVIHLGAAKLIRKNSDLDEVINELRPL
jgi:DNA-binding NarL/FixJ family response regulator